ncbi:hypothetical protein QVD17_11466 [Tagetes erecta]|uniref:GIR1-like zinc ribbon domain-containing protein n=1 Tax=Tagetes erecta TaxID=13708 RepID=A0AAD8KTI0_TARER|nr:hypothetical protein QVD17_11466 [Tagetes erecta]
MEWTRGRKRRGGRRVARGRALVLGWRKNDVWIRSDGVKLELKLNLAPPVMESSPITVSPSPKSCVSLELVQDETVEIRYSSSPETTSMMLAGCPRCLMYVMLAGEYPKCPKCKSSVLIDVVFDKPIKKMKN